MRTLLLLFLLSACCSTLLSAQQKAIQKAAIQKEYRNINASKTLKKKVLNNKEVTKEETDGGAQLTGYYSGTELKKMVSRIGLSNGNAIMEFYFKDNKLIFVYEQFRSFVYNEKQQSFRYDTTEVTFIGRYYFAGNKLIDMMTTGHNRFEDDSIDPEQALLKEAAEDKCLLKRKTY